MANTGKGSQDSQQGGGATAQPIGEQMGELTHQVQEQAGRLTDQVRSQVSSNLMSQKDRAASGLETVSMVLRQTGEQIRQQDQGMVAQYVEDAAQRVEQFSDQLRNQDLTQLVQETERFARRQPLLFAGAAITLGFLAVRFLRSTQPQESSTGYPNGGSSYGRDVYGSGYAGTMTDSSLGYGTGMGLGDTMGHGSIGGDYGNVTDELTLDMDIEGIADEATTSGRSAMPTDDRPGLEKL